MGTGDLYPASRIDCIILAHLSILVFDNQSTLGDHGCLLTGMVHRDYLDCRNQPAPLAVIDASLAVGKPVIVKVDFSLRAGLQSHWLVVRAKQDGDYLIQDPWPVPAEFVLGWMNQRLPVKMKDEAVGFVAACPQSPAATEAPSDS